MCFSVSNHNFVIWFQFFFCLTIFFVEINAFSYICEDRLYDKQVYGGVVNLYSISAIYNFSIFYCLYFILNVPIFTFCVHINIILKSNLLTQFTIIEDEIIALCKHPSIRDGCNLNVYWTKIVNCSVKILYIRVGTCIMVRIWLAVELCVPSKMS